MAVSSEFSDSWVNNISSGAKPTGSVRILDIGSGRMPSLGESPFASFENVSRISTDLSLRKENQSRFATYGSMAQATCAALPFPEASFDLVTVCNLFSLPNPRSKVEVWERMPLEIMRVLKPGGSLIVADHNTPTEVSLILEATGVAGLEMFDLLTVADGEPFKKVMANIFFKSIVEWVPPTSRAYVIEMIKPLNTELGDAFSYVADRKPSIYQAVTCFEPNGETRPRTLGAA